MKTHHARFLGRAFVRSCLPCLAAATSLSGSACQVVDAAAVSSRNDTTTASTTFSFAHGVRFFVSAVNCEMNTEDAERINALSHIPGVTVEVVFTGITGNDTSIVNRARADLGLTVRTRIIRVRELEQYKSIGGAQLPMALIVKGRQLKTVIAGEAMPRTVSIVESALTPTAPIPNNQSPEV